MRKIDKKKKKKKKRRQNNLYFLNSTGNAKPTVLMGVLSQLNYVLETTGKNERTPKYQNTSLIFVIKVVKKLIYKTLLRAAR
jgi:hypothetical protein